MKRKRIWKGLSFLAIPLFLAIMCGVWFSQGISAEAVTKPDVQLLSSNPETIRDGGGAYYGVYVPNISANVKISYQWYVADKEDADQNIWHKIDKSYSWASDWSKDKIYVRAEKGMSTWPASEQRYLKCKVTADQVSAWSEPIKLKAVKVEYLSEVKLKSSGDIKPSLLGNQNRDVTSTNTSKYTVEAVHWQVYNPADKVFMTMESSTPFRSSTTYRLRVTVKTDPKYGIQTTKGDGNRTICYLDGKRIQAKVSDENSDEYFLYIDYQLDASTEENMTRLDENAILIYDAPNGQKQDFLNYGNMVKILSISDDWVEVRYAHGEDVKVGWCAYDELFSDLPTQYHYYTVTTTRFNYR